jgi:hypothetical protein
LEALTNDSYLAMFLVFGNSNKKEIGGTFPLGSHRNMFTLYPCLDLAPKFNFPNDSFRALEGELEDVL